MDIWTLPTNIGFSFENCSRNFHLASKLGYELPKARKTGTTIAGLIYKDGVILGADTRATAGDIVADKNCSKIHYLAPNIFCCGAGTAADTEMTTRMISSQLDLHQLETGRGVRVITAQTLLKQKLFKYQGYISAALVVGGVDITGPHVHSIYPHGSTDELPYTTMGSGSLAAMAIFESGWRPEMELEEAKVLMARAISGGIFNDLGSGSNIDLCIISKDNKVDFIRPYKIANMKGIRVGQYDVPEGCTKVASSRSIPLEDGREVTAEEQMDVVDEHLDLNVAQSSY